MRASLRLAISQQTPLAATKWLATMIETRKKLRKYFPWVYTSVPCVTKKMLYSISEFFLVCRKISVKVWTLTRDISYLTTKFIRVNKYLIVHNLCSKYRWSSLLNVKEVNMCARTRVYMRVTFCVCIFFYKSVLLLSEL